jgi:hypothetical protein
MLCRFIRGTPVQVHALRDSITPEERLCLDGHTKLIIDPSTELKHLVLYLLRNQIIQPLYPGTMQMP